MRTRSSSISPVGWTPGAIVCRASINVGIMSICRRPCRSAAVFWRKTDRSIRSPKSATDPAFAETIECQGDPVLVIIEGLTMYLSEADVRQMFHIIDEKTEHATVLMEAMSAVFRKAYQGKVHRRKSGKVYLGHQRWKEHGETDPAISESGGCQPG